MKPAITSPIFDLNTVDSLLKLEVPQHDEENDQWFVQLYYGTVFNIMPSGKYYVPFACSNVEICEVCAAARAVPCTKENPCIQPEEDRDFPEVEVHCEACLDAQWHEQAERELDTINAFIVSGEGDPTDLFIQRIIEVPNNE